MNMLQVFPGPGPFRSYVLPKLLHAYGKSTISCPLKLSSMR